MLEQTIARSGEALVLRRAAGGPPLDLAVRAFIRAYRPDEIVGAVAQGDTSIVLSPSQLAGSPFESGIQRNDKVVLHGRVRNVQSVEPVLIDNRLVRINLQVRG